MTTPTLEYLTLSSIPIDNLPESAQDWNQDLIREAQILLNHRAWTSAKQWHNGQVTTYSLPKHAIQHKPKFHTSLNAESATTLKTTSATTTTTTGRRSWFGKQSSSSAHSTTHHGHDSEQDPVPISWWKRSSKLSRDQLGGISAMWQTLGLNHTQQEKEYVSDLHTIHEIKPQVWLKMYDLPFPTTNRSFLTYVTVIPTSKTSFIVIGLPIKDDSATTKSLEKHHVRGRFVSVEHVREVQDEETGETFIEWCCVSQSYAAGSIPTSLSESHMASTMASAVPTFLTWLKKRIPDLSKDCYPPWDGPETSEGDDQASSKAEVPDHGKEHRTAPPAPPQREPSSTAGAEQRATPHDDKGHHTSHARISLDKLRQRLSFQLRGDLAQVPAGTTTA